MGIRIGLACLALAACTTAEPPGGIADRDWYLVAIGSDTQLAATRSTRPTLRLDSESGRAAGFAGCNRFTGGYALAGASLRFGPLASTKMYCEPGQAVEDRYLAALGGVASWSVAGDELTLSSASGPVLRFRELAETKRVR